MPKFYDSKGQSYDLSDQIGRGGEGAVFSCPNDSGLVAKIYHEPIDEEKAEKLRWMAENHDEQLLKVAAWIVDTLHDKKGKTVGFLMPNVRAKEIHELYSLKSRRVHFPHATWKYLVHTAANVARAFYSLHRNGHVMGDVNHGNCVVLRDGTVKLIDCDSYSIAKGDFRYRCEVGVATHLAPELQGVDLSEIERETKHDNFGLAVIIFQLLFLGRHPFAGNYLGAEDKSLEDCIREQRFAYGDKAIKRSVKQPPGTLALDAVSPRIAAMLERAFVTMERPEPREWIEALEDLSESLKQCSLHVGHYYFQDLHACPWCALETQTGLMLFPFVSGATASGDAAFNIFTIENLVASLAVPNNLPAKPLKQNILPPPSPEAESARRENLSRFVTLAVLQFCIVIFLTAIAGAGVGFFIGALLMAGFIVTLNNSGKNSKIDLEVRLEKARQEWNQLENEWATGGAPNFNDDLALIRQRIGEHHHLQQESREKVKRLHDDVFHYKLDVYLSSFKIADAQINGVSAGLINRLKDGGIRSAADVEAKRLGSQPRVITDEIKEKLIGWRENLERAFVYDPDTEVPEGEQNRLMKTFSDKRTRIEREIENLLVSLRSGSTIIRQKQQTLSARAESVAKQLSQCESDLAAAGSITPPIVVLILITTLIPMFGNAFSSSRSPRYNSGLYDAPKVRVANGSGSGGGTVVAPSSINYTVPDNLTDDQIAKLTTAEKQAGAQQLLGRATDLADNWNNYKKAEQMLQLALKLEPNNVKVLNKLGEVLYQQRKYKDSLVHLNRALSIEPLNVDTKFSIGTNYLKMNYNEDARKIFADIVIKDARSFEGHFNLGQAFKGLNNYYSAVSSFRTATEIRPQDADAHYELGFCLNKIGSKDEVLDEYYKLEDLNPALAEKLRKETKLQVPTPRVEMKSVGDGQGRGIGTGTGNGYGVGTGRTSP